MDSPESRFSQGREAILIEPNRPFSRKDYTVEASEDGKITIKNNNPEGTEYKYKRHGDKSEDRTSWNPFNSTSEDVSIILGEGDQVFVRDSSHDIVVVERPGRKVLGIDGVIIHKLVDE